MSIASTTVRAKLTQSQKRAIIDHYHQDPKLSLVRVGNLYGYSYNQMNYLFYQDKFGKSYHKQMVKASLAAEDDKTRQRVPKRKRTLTRLEKIAKKVENERKSRLGVNGRITYSEDLRVQCCEAIIECGHVAKVSENTGISSATLYKWFKELCPDVYDKYVSSKRWYTPPVSGNEVLIEEALKQSKDFGVTIDKTARKYGIKPATLYTAVSLYTQKRNAYQDGVAKGINICKENVKKVLERTDIDDPLSIRKAISEILD